MLSGNFAEMTTSTPFRDLLYAANLRHGTEGFTSPPKEGVLRIFIIHYMPVKYFLFCQHNHALFFLQSFTLLFAMNNQLSASNSKLNDYHLFILHSVKILLILYHLNASSRAFFRADTGLTIRSLTCVIVRFF